MIIFLENIRISFMGTDTRITPEEKLVITFR